MKYEIMLRILFELLAKKNISASYLANKYGISQRSVYRYIETIEYAGVPIYTNRGKNGGFVILDSFKMPSYFITEEELNAVIAPLESINKQAYNQVLDNAIIKLKGLKRKSGNFDLVKTDGLIVDASSWISNNAFADIMTQMVRAINENKVINITYCNSKGETSNRMIEPHVLVLKQGLWYIFAFCRMRNDFRFFKIGRITDLEIINEKFVKHYNSPTLPFERWFETAKTEEIILKVDETAVRDVEEWLGMEAVKTDENGDIIASAILPTDSGLIEKLMSFGDKIKVVSPKEIQKKIISTAKSIIKNYS